MNDNRTIGQLMADIASNTMGSWRFVIFFSVFILVWCIGNIYFHNSIDPYPYTFLNFILAVISGIMMPLIMISQGRQEEIQKKTIEDIASIARATLEIARAVREQIKEQTELLEEHMHDEN